MSRKMINPLIAFIVFLAIATLPFGDPIPPANVLGAFIQLMIDGYSLSEIRFWWSSAGYILSKLLERSSCSHHLQKEYLSFFVRHILPLLGPTPRDFQRRGIRPSSYLSDDHTPIEVIWVVEGQNRKPSIRFAMEPLSYHDGYPLPPTTWIKILHSLADFKFMKSFDSRWPDTCYNTLVYNPKENTDTLTSQFFLGGDFTPQGMVAKLYFIPKLRAQKENCSCTEIVTRCIHELGLTESWNLVLSHIDSLPETSRPSIEMVAVDCVKPSQNRLKVYFRSHENTFNALANHLTLGGRLTNQSSQRTLDTLRALWGFLFPGVETDEPLPIKDESKRNWPGFLIYYELTPKSPLPFPKIYIPVRQYCENDAQIASALSQYLFCSMNNLAAAKEYESEFHKLMNHRNPSSRTGIHTYVACCGRPAGPQLSIYLSPEIFAEERKDYYAGIGQRVRGFFRR